MTRIPTPRAEIAMRVYAACGVACILLGYVALWWAYGWTPLLVAIGVAVMVLAGVARWVTGGGEWGGGE